MSLKTALNNDSVDILSERKYRELGTFHIRVEYVYLLPKRSVNEWGKPKTSLPHGGFEPQLIVSFGYNGTPNIRPKIATSGWRNNTTI